MSTLEWSILYGGGVVLGVLQAAIGRGEGVFPNGRYHWAWSTLSIVFWPLMLPLSFLALWCSACYFGPWLGLWVVRNLGGTYEVHGVPVVLPAPRAAAGDARTEGEGM